ncbi:molybdopterin dinucleotide binding domain-containing protein [Streptomyces glomeratus]|uniref:Molybdopterin dinucleotide-binding domain-containing protein n=1 Tax=Streptomyces glomeratus TaxID=284452 RepID=A0ABP6L562_9ACTN|nr:molybdopterin dinucleotide binding domain-containing protein [Streptomyces glomeratus]MCF1509618.1 hypothetical protein [Streptomyces glomeratus]
MPRAPSPGARTAPTAHRIRAFTANTIFRDNTWRERDQQDALRVSPHDAERLGLSDGALAQITASPGTAEAVVESDARLQPGTRPCRTASASTCPPKTAATNAPASP